jgi:hypothetical protein
MYYNIQIQDNNVFICLDTVISKNILMEHNIKRQYYQATLTKYNHTLLGNIDEKKIPVYKLEIAFKKGLLFYSLLSFKICAILFQYPQLNSINKCMYTFEVEIDNVTHTLDLFNSINDINIQEKFDTMLNNAEIQNIIHSRMEQEDRKRIAKYSKYSVI